MSSDRPSVAPSPGTEGDSAAELTRARGEVLLEALDHRVAGARGHADATAAYGLATAVQLGLDREACLLTREAARLHEVGKLYVRAPLLTQQEGELSRRARRELDAHVVAGHGLARGAGVPEPACEAILRSGERFDAGDDPPMQARVIAAACEYDKLLRRHAGSGGAGRRRAMIELIESAGGRLDPNVADALARVVRRAAGRIAGS